jgi:hypothetical protein
MLIRLQLTVLASWVACGSVAAQQRRPAQPASQSTAAVRLEAHEGQTEFKLGDPVILDLVFTSQLPGYVVDTDQNPYLPTSDEATIAPGGGWIRSHSAYRGKGQNGNAQVDLGTGPVRVPVLLNRTILFQKPGHYVLTIKTERLRLSSDWTATTEDCKPCRTTNAIGIDIAPRDEQEETALVASLSKELEETRESESGAAMTEQERTRMSSEAAPLARELDTLMHSGSPDEEKLKALLQKENDILTKQFALVQQRKDGRRATAQRLAYLDSDEAIRAKVHFIVEAKDGGDADSIACIIVDGLSSSNNWQLQMNLLQAAWRDPSHVPTDVLHTALRQSKELLEEGRGTDEIALWPGTPQEREAELTKYRSELNEIVATLPQRTAANRASTIAYLDGLAVQVDH